MKKTVFEDKKGIIRILEAFIAISLIIVMVVLVIEENNPQREDTSKVIYSAQIGILRNIQINLSHRAEILGVTPPLYWNDTSFPIGIKQEIEEKKPSYLDCRAKICEIGSVCNLEEKINKNVYAQSVFISANTTTYSPKELKIFCWEK